MLLRVWAVVLCCGYSAVAAREETKGMRGTVHMRDIVVTRGSVTPQMMFDGPSRMTGGFPAENPR